LFDPFAESLRGIMSQPRILAFDYQNVGFECLRELIERRENIVAVVTHKANLYEGAWFAYI
jgi:hypothetical protein